ncbi:hypothetical protein BJX62DRAFT_192808 [Aspergillus germanicus]
MPKLERNLLNAQSAPIIRFHGGVFNGFCHVQWLLIVSKMPGSWFGGTLAPPPNFAIRYCC